MSPRYEPIVIQRSSVSYDEMGNEVRNGFVDHLVLEAVKFAPTNSDEPVEPGRNAVITGGTVYVRDLSEEPDIVASDRVKIRGMMFTIEGEIGAWLRKDSWAIQFGVKRVTG